MADKKKEISESLQDIATEIKSQGFPRWQYQRLGSFLVASAFLVASFFTLVGIDTCYNSFISHDTQNVLIHFVACLGAIISVIYLYMNVCVSIKNSINKINRQPASDAQTVHTWVIPLVFLVFWVGVWKEVPHWSWSNWWIVIIVLFSLGILFLIFRKWLSRQFKKIYLFYKKRRKFIRHRFG